MMCRHCGYEGPPVVSACECREVRRSNIAFLARELREIDAGKVPAPGEWTRERLEAELTISRNLPDARCAPRTVKHCGHGLLACPTCGADPRWERYDGDAEHLLSLIRAVRKALQ
jgi:hypothetical protein